MFGVANTSYFLMNNVVAINHLPNIIMNIVKFDKDKIIVAQYI